MELGLPTPLAVNTHNSSYSIVYTRLPALIIRLLSELLVFVVE